jgi:hypothetical protein
MQLELNSNPIEEILKIYVSLPSSPIMVLEKKKLQKVTIQRDNFA